MRAPKRANAVVAWLRGKHTAMKAVLDDHGNVALKISEEKLAIIPTNMVDNSARHGASELTVTVRRKGAEAEITVADQGEGVSSRNAARLFEPSFTTARNEGGPGCGCRLFRRCWWRWMGRLSLLAVRVERCFWCGWRLWGELALQS